MRPGGYKPLVAADGDAGNIEWSDDYVDFRKNSSPVGSG
jgi:hypothetical protein